MAQITVIIEGKEELRKIDRYEISEDIVQMPIPVPWIQQNEEILRTFDGKTIIIKRS